MIPAWMERGNCVGVDDPDIFFPEKGKAVPKEARVACASCPVAAECLQHAIDNDELGYWGGITETKRQRMPGGRRDPNRPERDDSTCINGHPWTPETLHVQPDGRRRCRVCRVESTRRYNARKNCAA